MISESDGFAGLDRAASVLGPVLPQLVRAILEPMFRLFDFATFDLGMYAEIVERFKRGVVS